MKQLLHLPFQVGERDIQGFPPRVDNDRPLRTQLVEPEAHRLPDPPFNSVARHGPSERPRRSEPDPRTLNFRSPHAEGRETRPGVLAALIVDGAEIRGSQQTDTFRKTGDARYLSSLTVSFFRPRARRRASTARPFLVDMRTRNPCVLARWRLFG